MSFYGIWRTPPAHEQVFAEAFLFPTDGINV